MVSVIVFAAETHDEHLVAPAARSVGIISVLFPRKLAGCESVNSFSLM